MRSPASILRQPAGNPAASRAQRSGIGLESALHWLIVSLLVFAPLAFGAVEAWSEQIVIAWSLAIGLCFSVMLVRDPAFPVARSWTFLAVAAFLLLAGLHLLPLSHRLLQSVSPGTSALRSQLLEVRDNQQAASLTLYRLATEHDLRLLIAIAIVFAVSVNVYRDIAKIKKLLSAVAILGGAMAALALLQDLTGTAKIYWFVPGVLPKATAGTFICYSHFSQFMTLSIGASLALLLLLIGEAFGSRHHRARLKIGEVIERLRDSHLRAVWLLAVSVIIGVTTIFLSMSRGGMVALLISMVAATIALTFRRSRRAQGWIIVVLAIGAFCCLLYSGFDAVYTRLITLQNPTERYQDRWQIVKDIGIAWTKFPIFGTGLGTHEWVFPMFDRSTMTSLAVHAENEYAQVLEETGTIGLLIVITFISIIIFNYFRALRSRRPGLRPIAIGLGFGLLGILIHSWSDFGQHLPANAHLTAVLCAIIVNLGNAAKRISERVPGAARFSSGSRWLGIAGAMAIIFLSLWAIPTSNAAREGEAYWNRAQAIATQLEASAWRGTNEDFAKLILDTQSASAADPGNARYRYWLNVYRWRSISRDIDESTGELVVYPRTPEHAARIVGDLHEVQRLCPAFGPSYALAGQLEFFILHRRSGASEIRKGYALAKCDPAACFAAGCLDVHEGQWDASLEKFRRSKALGTPVAEIAQVYIRRANRPDLALAFAGDDALARLEIAGLLDHTPGNEALAASLHNAAERQRRSALEAQSQQPDATADSLASLADLYCAEKNYSNAISLYRRALVENFGQATWRLALAQALLKTGKSEEALKEARICIRLQPDLEGARKIVADLAPRAQNAAGE